MDISLTFSEETGSQPVIGGAGSGRDVNELHLPPCFCCFRYMYDPSTSTMGVLAWVASRTLNIEVQYTHMMCFRDVSYCHKDHNIHTVHAI